MRKADTVKRLLSGVKTFRELFENLDLYRFTSCFDMFISCGTMQDEALKKSLDIVEGAGLKAKLARCIEKMEGGASFSQAACDEKLYDSINNRMLKPLFVFFHINGAVRKGISLSKSSNTVFSVIFQKIPDRTDGITSCTATAILSLPIQNR